MKRVYECEIAKKGELTKLLEAEPYAPDSFARNGYKTKEGAVIGEDKAKFYLFLSADEAFLKKAEEKIKGLAARANEDVEKRIAALVEKEEDSATEGFGGIFG
ncbi:MAG: hypothetical protein WC488_00185 [Candidatus Micrarchaeia archaeon]